ncbi:MAG: hypothetical protein LBQ50_09820 [Planctomycetaceae bacterium]|jgi:hypothetical protein|nr:hypothetical protein [Planctomycetaceae bacterium]
MKRSIILILLIFSGCQSMPHEQEPTVLVDARQQPGAAEKFLVKAAQFFRSAMPETEHVAAQRNPTPFSAAKPPYPATQAARGSSQPVDPLPFYMPARSKTPSSIQASRMLFNFDLAENEPEITDSETSEPEFPEPETPELPKSAAPRKNTQNTAKTNILQPQNGDSESFRQLLKLIAKTPKENRGVDDAKLEQLLTKFRNEDWEEIPELETSYLLHLRNKILPDYRPSPKPKQTDEDLEDLEEKDEFYATNHENRNPAQNSAQNSAPLPPSKPSVLRRSLADSSTPSRYAQSRKPIQTDENQETEEQDSIPSREIPPMETPPMAVPSSAFPSMASLPLPTNPQPIYPKIAQLDGSQAIVPAGYHPPYGNQYGTAGEPRNIVHADYTNSATVPPNSLNNKEWESLVRMGADQLRYKIEQTPHGRTFANEGRLRILEMLLGNRNEAVKPITGADKPINEFMANQMLGFAAFLDEAGIPEQRTRNINALFRFDESLMELRKVCPIKLKKVQFVKGWETFGFFTPRSEDCHAGEVLELYMELENPTVRHTQQGFNVSASVSYEIRDRTANVLQKIDRIAVQETTPSQKRDYCIGLRVALPEKIPPGSYQLRVSVTDMNDETMPYAEEQVPFKVIPVTNPEN